MIEKPRSFWQSPWIWFFILAAALAGLVIFLVTRYPEAVDGDGKMNLVYSLAVLGFLLGSAFLHRRFKPGHVVRNILAWAGIGVVLLAGYSYRYELGDIKNRLMGELFPQAGMETTGGKVSIRASQGGHFIVEATVDGVAVRFLVDTGASDVVLSPRDAQRLGFDIKTLAFNRAYATANGIVMGAPVRLGHVGIGSITLADVRASVNAAPMKRSLLGMSFLSRLSGFDVSRDMLVLRP